MLSRLKELLLIAAAAGAVYFLMSYHIIIFGSGMLLVSEVHLLKKSKLHLHETFVSLNEPEAASQRGIAVEPLFKSKWLRQDGIGPKLVEWKIITEDRRRQLENKFPMSFAPGS